MRSMQLKQASIDIGDGSSSSSIQRHRTRYFIGGEFFIFETKLAPRTFSHFHDERTSTSQEHVGRSTVASIIQEASVYTRERGRRLLSFYSSRCQEEVGRNGGGLLPFPTFGDPQIFPLDRRSNANEFFSYSVDSNF